MYEKQVVYGELKGIKLEVEISVIPAVEPLSQKPGNKTGKETKRHAQRGKRIKTAKR